MKKLTGSLVSALFCCLLMTTTVWSDAIYRVVDENGNVTYTDQPPGDGSEPMVLPELSIIEIVSPPESPDGSEGTERVEALNSADLRKLYHDFGIIQPQDQDAFWGTANEVVVTWGSDEPLQDGMTVKLLVDGVARDVSGFGSTSLALDRGEHTVRVELFNGGRRPVMVSPIVTFFIRQASMGFNSKPALPFGN